MYELHKKKARHWFLYEYTKKTSLNQQALKNQFPETSDLIVYSGGSQTFFLVNLLKK